MSEQVETKTMTKLN